MQLNKIAALAGKELGDATRNRWFWIYSASFTLLALAVATTSLLGAGFNGLAGFGRTTASLINLVLLVVPLMGLTAGTQSLAQERERGTLAYLLAQPVNRTEVFLGKYLGQALALGSALGVGFGISGLVLQFWGGGESQQPFLVLAALSLLLAWANLGLGMLIGVLVGRVTTAIGAAVMLWLALACLGDLALMGGAVWTGMGAGTLFHLSLANPLPVFRMASILALRASLETLGPAGLFATHLYGSATLALLLGVLALWVIVPALASWVLFLRRSVV